MKRKHARNRRLTFRKIPKGLLLRNPGLIHVTRLIARAIPYTQLKFGALLQMNELVHEVNKANLLGAVVETGCGRGGCGALVAKTIEEGNTERDVWLFDSFQGLSEPTEEDKRNSEKPMDKVKKGYLKVGKEVVDEAIKVMGLEHPERVHVVEGWFEETIPGVKNDIGPIAILRMDADLYEPTKYVLEQLYDQVVEGGFVVIDDYKNWVGCRQALYEFFIERGVYPRLEHHPRGGKVYFKKPLKK